MHDVAIVEDHLLLAETLKTALEHAGVGASIAPAAPLPDLLDDLLMLRPDLVLLDLDLDGFGDCTPMIAPLVDHGVRVLVVSGTTDRLRMARAFEQGAIGFQSKASDFTSLLTRALTALTARGPLDAEERVRLLDELRQSRRAEERELAPYRRLTYREQDTLRALCCGRSVNEIAKDWVVAEATVRSHVRGVLSKLGVGSQLAAVAAATRSGWLAG